jgi:hypothetical protein
MALFDDLEETKPTKGLFEDLQAAPSKGLFDDLEEAPKAGGLFGDIAEGEPPKKRGVFDITQEEADTFAQMFPGNLMTQTIIRSIPSFKGTGGKVQKEVRDFTVATKVAIVQMDKSNILLKELYGFASKEETDAALEPLNLKIQKLEPVEMPSFTEWIRDPKKFMKAAELGVAGTAPQWAAGWAQGQVLGGAMAIPGFVVGGPAGAGTAYGIGTTAGAMQFWARQGAAEMWEELRKDPDIDRTTAQIACTIGGSIYGAIEFSQFGKFFPGAATPAKQLVKRSALQSAKVIILRYGIRVGGEVLEEGEQGAIVSATTDIVKEVSALARKSDEWKEGVPTYQQMGESVKGLIAKIPAILTAASIRGANDLVESIPTMAAIGAPATGVDIARQIKSKETLEKEKAIIAREEREKALIPEAEKAEKEREAAIELQEEVAKSPERIAAEVGRVEAERQAAEKSYARGDYQKIIDKARKNKELAFLGAIETTVAMEEHERFIVEGRPLRQGLYTQNAHWQASSETSNEQGPHSSPGSS